MLIYTTKTALGRSIDRSDDTVHRMLGKWLVQVVYAVNWKGKKKKVGYIVSSKRK